ncbi:transmembrane protease serine 11D-like [Cloeon dipterum]|uniref:transmembrane protease serine 11D-like n=1 Tax=Cloeon dipterum TaxID=197152 RepID=UPI00321FDEAA
MTLKSAFSLLLLGFAVCVALAEKDRIPAPYFTDGENLSTENCGVHGERDWIVEIAILHPGKLNICFGAIISHRTVLTYACDLQTDDFRNVSVYINDCMQKNNYNVEKCTGSKIEVRDVILMNSDLLKERAYKYPMYILKTKKMPDNISPICLFNRGNQMDLVEDPQSKYISWSTGFLRDINQTSYISNIESKPYGEFLSYDRCLVKLSKQVEVSQLFLQTRFLCLRQEHFLGNFFLVNYYRGRHFIRGISVHYSFVYNNSAYVAYIDILPYIESIVWNSNDMSVLSPVPSVKSIRAFRSSDNLSFSNCGRKTTAARSKRETGDEVEDIRSHQLILAGRRARRGAHPWHAAVESSTGFSCGGSLISKKVVLTAAHCIEGQRAEDFEVTIGMYNKTLWNSTDIQIKTPSRLKIHPKYSRGKFHYDVGLMIFEKAFELTEHVHPICLWNEDTNLDAVAGRAALVAGYGYFKDYSHPATLQEAEITIRSHLECYHSLRKYYGARLKPGDNFCAGYTNGTTVCNGDSGSSLSLEKDGRWFIRGIVSFAKSKKVKINGEEAEVCDPDAFPLFSDVAYYIDWIVEFSPDINFDYFGR